MAILPPDCIYYEAAGLISPLYSCMVIQAGIKVYWYPLRIFRLLLLTSILLIAAGCNLSNDDSAWTVDGPVRYQAGDNPAWGVPRL